MNATFLARICKRSLISIGAHCRFAMVCGSRELFKVGKKHLARRLLEQAIDKFEGEHPNKVSRTSCKAHWRFVAEPQRGLLSWPWYLHGLVQGELRLKCFSPTLTCMLDVGILKCSARRVFKHKKLTTFTHNQCTWTKARSNTTYWLTKKRTQRISMHKELLCCAWQPDFFNFSTEALCL